MVLAFFFTIIVDDVVKTETFQGVATDEEQLGMISVDACTTIIVGKSASIDGSTMTTHTNDCFDCDPRLAKVPPTSGKLAQTRPIYLDKSDYPRFVGHDQGTTYLPKNLDYSIRNWSLTIPIGSIPGVEETYGYIDATYGIVNDRQLSIGESTCAARFVALPVSQGGQALVSVRILTRIALERCKTARCAVLLIGSLSVQYGFYGEVWDGPNRFVEAGEALTIADPKETWIIHVLPDDTGSSAVWAAQRVPDDHISIVANAFIIRKIDLSSPDFLASDNVFEVAQRTGFWDPDRDGEFDFTKAYALPRSPTLALYSTRRVWRVLSWANPSLNLNPNTDTYGSDYPFSVKPSRLLSVQDIMNIQRDHFEGTEFDLSKGPAGGPYGDVTRFDPAPQPGLTLEQILTGHFERAISIHRTSYGFVTQSRDYLPEELGGLVWFASYAPHMSYYAPIYSKINDVPELYMTGSLYRFDIQTPFWISTVLGNYASRFYKYAIEDIKTVQAQSEEEMFIQQKIVEEQAVTLLEYQGENAVATYLTEYTDQQAKAMHSTWTQLFYSIVTKYHDGFSFNDLTAEALMPQKLFYPSWWLYMVGFFTSSESKINPEYNQFYVSQESTIMIAITTFTFGGVLTLFFIHFFFNTRSKRLPLF